MAMTDLPLFTALHRRGEWLTERQAVVARNIANADTPSFRPQDLKPQQFHDLIDRPAKVVMATTEPGHLAPAATSDADADSEQSRQVYETAPDGNAVVLEEQLAKMDQTAIDHRLVTQLYRKFLNMLKLAATSHG
jgi:flagellar basal-body rod protein FlgB